MDENEIQYLIRCEKRKYAREWRERNPEKVREANRRYWEKRVRERLAREKQANV